MKKSIFLFFAAILCAMSANAKVVYLKLNDKWSASEARYYVHVWGGSSSNTSIEMQAVEGETNMYKIEVGTHNGIIFLRHKTTTNVTESNKWNDLLNRLGNLSIPEDKNCCTINNGVTTVENGNDNGAGSSVTWSTYTPAEPEPEPEPVETHDITVKAKYPAAWNAGKAAIHFWGDGVASPGTPAAMEKDGDWWSYTVTGVPTTSPLSVIFINGDNWDGDANQTVDITGITESTCYQVTAGSGKASAAKVDCESTPEVPEPEPTELTYNVTVPAGTKACYICGNMTGWSFTGMTKVDDTHYTITIEGAKQNDGYKYASGSDWGYVEKDANGNEIGDRTYVDGNDVVARWASVYDPDAVEQELTYSVTVPEGTYACYIAMDTDPAQDGWEFNEMTKVDDTHYTFTRTGLKSKTYKYASGAGWEYVEKTDEDGEVADRTWAENDVVAKWASVYNPSAPTYDYYVIGTVNNWGLKDENFGMTDEDADGVYEKEVTLTANNKHELKINNGSWDDNTQIFGFDQLNVAYEGVSRGSGDGDNNVVIELTEDKTITVKFDKNAGKITLDGLTEVETETLVYTVEVPEGTEDCYIAGQMNNWEFERMTQVNATQWTITYDNVLKTTEYKYACQADWAYAEVIEGGGNRTEWQELDQVEEWGKPVIVTYQLKGVGGWEQPGIELVQNPGNDKEYMLTCQAISATDAIKVVRLEDGVIKDYYGNGTVKDGVEVTVNYDGDGNITLPEGKYNFYFDTNEPEKKLWIAAATDCQTVTEITLTEGDNSSALATEGVVTVTVDRDFEKGKLYTIALPFTINTAASVFGNGTVVYNFANLAYDKTNEEYILGFTKVSKIEAGKPYLIEPGLDVNGFVAENVTLSSATSVSKTVKVDNVEKTATMTAVLSKTTTGGSYWLAEDRYLYNGEVNMPALRALFVLPTTPSGMPARARVALKEDAATGVEDLFTTDAPVKVIQNGQLIIIRDGVKYNVQGQVIR